MRRVRWVAGALAALLVLPLFLGGLAYAGLTYAAEPSPRFSSAPSPDGSLAGSRAGVGRTPPGRVLPPAAETPPPSSTPDSPEGSATPTPRRPDRPAEARQSLVPRGYDGPVVNVLPLGAGLLLTGLGIGFLALRLRR
ncbi:hypothetical protein GTY65_33145 [Streptomyces sp. SID8379]|uniref:hypothetical protein n=1 Tax=unclassified Streptomyces TaxID=2593676 RepID=UPI0006881A64|nr:MULTISPECIES: hypothetical protein [unclassified Streptomyces]MYW68887.1 hypothetical protein [Streptomyces sp. SID8379]